MLFALHALWPALASLQPVGHRWVPVPANLSTDGWKDQVGLQVHARAVLEKVAHQSGLAYARYVNLYQLPDATSQHCSIFPWWGCFVIFLCSAIWWSVVGVWGVSVSDAGVGQEGMP